MQAYKRAFLGVRFSLLKCDIFLVTWFSFPGKWALSRPSFWFTRRLQKRTLRIFPVGDDASILLFQESSVVLLTRMSDLRRGRCAGFGLLISSRTVLHDRMIVVKSKMLIVIMHKDAVLRCFKVL